MRSVFISHSIKDQGDEPQRDAFETAEDFEVAHASWRRAPALVALRERIADLLADELDVEPWLDQRKLDPPAEWRDGLHSALARAHGAVILLDRKAVSSDWVRKEATILTWLKAIDMPVAIVPVLVEIDPQELSSHGLAPLQLPEIQAVRLSDAELQDVEAAAAQVLSAVRRGLGGLPDTSPPDDLDRWIADLQVHLERARNEHILLMFRDLGLAEGNAANPETLLGAFRTNSFGQPTPEDVLKHCLAAELVLSDMRQAADAFAELGNLPNMDWSTIVKLLRPLWVEAEQAQAVPYAAHQKAGERLLVVAVPDQRTCMDVLLRGTFATPRLRLLRYVPPSATNADDFVDSLLEALGEWVDPPDVARDVKIRGPIFVVLDVTGLPPDLAARITRALLSHEHLRHLTLLLAMSPGYEELVHELGHAVLLRPSSAPVSHAHIDRALKPLSELISRRG